LQLSDRFDLQPCDRFIKRPPFVLNHLFGDGRLNGAELIEERLASKLIDA